MVVAVEWAGSWWFAGVLLASSACGKVYSEGGGQYSGSDKSLASSASASCRKNSLLSAAAKHCVACSCVFALIIAVHAEIFLSALAICWGAKRSGAMP
eukprot:6457821-Amphidinium_carterae.4